MLTLDYINDSGISNSDIGLLKESPWFFRQVKDKKVERITTDYFELGTLIHLAVLQPELFVVAEIDKPGGIMGKFLGYYIEAGCNEEALKYAYDKSGYKLPLKTIQKKIEEDNIVEYINFVKESKDRLVLTKQQKYVIDNAIKGIERNPTASNLLLDSYSYKDVDILNETSYFGVLDGIRLKGQPDRIILDHSDKIVTLIDLKSTSSVPYFRIKRIHNTGELTVDYVGTGFFGSFKGHSYYRQLAFYKTLLFENYRQLFNNGYKFQVFIIAINTTLSFDCSVIQISDEWLDYGRKEIEEYIQRYKFHLKENQWDFPILDSKNGLINA